jgi:hypothetical protein
VQTAISQSWNFFKWSSFGLQHCIGSFAFFDVSETRTASIFMVTELILVNGDMMRWNQVCRVYYRKVPGNIASHGYAMQFTLKMEMGHPIETP